MYLNFRTGEVMPFHKELSSSYKESGRLYESSFTNIKLAIYEPSNNATMSMK